MTVAKFLKHAFSYTLLMVLAAGTFYFAYMGLKPVTHEKKEIVIPKGYTTSEIASLLTREEIVQSRSFFLLTTYIEGVESSLLSGKYTMTTNSSYVDVIDQLEQGPPITTYMLTIPEGYTIDEIADRLANSSSIDTTEFRDYAKFQANSFNYSFLSGNKSQSLEGYLFPKTYEVEKKTDAYGLVNLLLKQFGKETASLDLTSASKMNLTFHEIITVASLIEEEAKLSAEKPLVASVIYNRMRIGMPLQIDATIQYALPERKPFLNYDDLQIESPYNSYKNLGLPPGPIANPGIDSIKAALSPASTKYIYYVLSDKSGKHTFTETYEAFLTAKAAARKYFQY